MPPRRLIHVPIVHGLVDLGSQQELVRKAHVTLYGLRSWRQHVESVAQFWRDVRQRLRAYEPRAAGMRIYQDGLPVCGRELDLVRELAGAGSENYRLILELAGRGAQVMGTESPELLRHERERRCIQPAAGATYDALMEERDRFVADRIGATLGPLPELGLLFMGALHRVTENLAGDIEVVGRP